MTKATSSTKKTTTKATSKKTTTKTATKKAAAPSRSASKARTATKKTTATRNAAQKATTAKTATKAKPAAKAVKKTATKTAAKPAAKKATSPQAKKAAAKKPATKAKLPAKASKKAAPTSAEDKPKIAPAPLRPALRVARRAEARRDKNQTFKVNTQIIYPAHGVGHIVDVEKQSIADIEVELFVINFEHEKMKLRVPVAKAAAAGMRNLSTATQINDALKLVEGKARIKRTMWSRRAQEYEAKINSGDLISVTEVVRDLFRADDQPEQSYSERQLFEQARERLGREVAAVRKGTLEEAIAEIHKHLDKKEKV